MNMIRFLIISLCGLFIFSAQAAQSPQKNERDFDTYVEGALAVYSQFKTPSKQESESFYQFIISKWSYTSCNHDCLTKGEKVAEKYVELKNIEIKPK